ncbi:MAG: MG2 domain-containing protein, partial [Steroidobacteraceae bacterium]
MPTKAQGENLDSVQFKAPFPELSAIQVYLPQGLVDDAGRTLENAARFPLTLRIDDYPPLAKFSGDFGILEANEGGVLPVTLRNVEPNLTATESVLPAKLLRLDADPLAIAHWLRRVEAAGEYKSEREAIPDTEKNNPEAAKPKLGTDEEDEEAENDAGPGFRWRNDTGAKSVFTDSDATTSFSLTKPSGKKAFEVVGIPLKTAGFYVVELPSRILGQSLLGRDTPRYVATSVLVTDLSVHFKWGREASLAWVTRLHDAAPVANAQVIIINACTGLELWRGTTDTSGLAAVSTSLGTPHARSGCESAAWPPLLVMAKTASDYSFTVTDWDKGIDPSEFGMPFGSEQGNRVFHTVLDRSLFRVGETVSMKHFLRQRTMNAFATPSGLPSTRRIVIEHQGSGQKYTLSAAFDRDGIAETEWKIPAEAKLGNYTVSIQDGQSQWQSAQFQVQEFRLPSMRGTVSGAATPLINPKSVDVDLHVAYLSGGGAAGLSAKLRTLIQPQELRFAGFSDFQFGGKPVSEGIVNNDTSTGSYDFEEDDSDETETSSSEAPAKTQIIPLTLDANGSARVTVPGIPALPGAARLTA